MRCPFYPRRVSCFSSESAHLAVIALCLQLGYPSHNKLLVLIMADFDVAKVDVGLATRGLYSRCVFTASDSLPVKGCLVHYCSQQFQHASNFYVGGCNASAVQWILTATPE